MLDSFRKNPLNISLSISMDLLWQGQISDATMKKALNDYEYYLFPKDYNLIMKQKKVRFLVGSLLIVGAIGYLITMGISNTSQYFFTVDELLSQKVSYAG